MKKLTLFLLLLIASRCSAQGTAPDRSNPLGGDIRAQSTACGIISSCVWQKLPVGSTTVTATVSNGPIGAFSATLQFEQSNDGINFVAASPASTTVPGTFSFTVTGFTDFRVRASVYASGDAAVNLQAAGPGSGGGGGGGGSSFPVTTAVTVNSGGSITTTGTGSIAGAVLGWHRLGTIIGASLAADQFSFAESRTIIDTNCPLLPNLLVGETCFRTWGAAGYSAGCIAYFEAPTADPFAQVRSATCTPAGHAHITVRKLDSTHYYLIGTNSFGGATGIDIYSSATGNQDWALLQANIVVLGGVGAFDHNNLGNVDIHFAGDLDATANVYLYYEGQDATPKWAMGLATCSSACFGGAATWTKSGSNPLMVTPASEGGCEIRLFGSTYYARCHGELSIPSGGTATLPSDLTGVWTASAPAGPWTAPTTLDLQRATFDEGPNGFVGQLNKPTTLDLNGICYLFYSATTDGGQQGGGFHTKLAVANGTCAQMAVTKGGSIEPDRFSGQEWATINTAFAPQGPGLMIGSGISTTQTPAPDLFIQKVTNVAQTTHTAYYMMNAWAQTGVSPIQIRSTFGSGGFQFNSSATTTANGSLWWLLTPGGVNQNILYSFFDANGHAPLNIAAPYWLTANGSNNDITGELAFAAATTATYTWTGVYTSHPECTATPQFDLTATPPRVWITYSTTVSFTINTSAAVTGSFSYHCIGRN